MAREIDGKGKNKGGREWEIGRISGYFAGE
jgi:hypothetical protein